MKIVTWNVNSLKARTEFVGLYLDAEAPDVLCIQELKLDTDAVPVELFESRGYHVAMHAQRQWNGVLIASRQPIVDVHRGLLMGDDGQARLVAGTTGGIRFVNLYCPQGQRVDSPKFPYKLRFYDTLIDWLPDACDLAAPLVVLGDLNIAPTADDIWDPERFRGVPSFHPEEHARWERLVGLGFTDLARPHLPPGTYSFWDYRAGAFHKGQGMRIDHVLGTAPVVPRVQGAWVGRDWRKKQGEFKASDHAPVTVELAD